MNNPSGSEEEVSIASKVPESTKREIRVRAAMEGLTMSKWVRVAIEEKLEREEQGEGNDLPHLVAAN